MILHLVSSLDINPLTAEARPLLGLGVAPIPHLIFIELMTSFVDGKGRPYAF